MTRQLCILTIFIGLALTSLLTSCTDGKKIPGGYILLWVNGCYNLDYELDGGNGHGRVDCVDEVGWTDKYMFAKSQNEYYWYDKSKDEKYLNPEEIVNGPFTNQQFLNILDSLKVKDFEFQIKI